MKLVIVESPSKAKTLNKYLGQDYKVVASLGHIRDVPSKSGSVLPDQDFLITYTINEKAQKYLDEIIKYSKKADEIYLATDPDREGEAISWHVAEVLKESGIVTDASKFKRITFNEITKKAVLDAIAHPRMIDEDLVNAQQARRSLDYLVGFTLSPLLWKKLPGCKSAGRVQSVALRIICEREDEIEHFKTQEFWDVKLEVKNAGGKSFSAMLSHIDGKKLEKFSLVKEADALVVKERLDGQNFTVADIQRKQQKRNPYAPFITSSLQQEASRKLGFNAKKTMQIAQKLYEGIDIKGETIGLITYMRTDGVNLAQDAVEQIRALILQEYGKEYLPASPRLYKSKAKNAQEAHEAIRPTDIKLIPDNIASFLDDDQRKLYDLIWKRTMACQMENVVIDMVGADLRSNDGQFLARATGSTIVFDGFYKIYREGLDDEQDEENKTLPPLEQGEDVEVDKILPQQHFTSPPPRYSEASLVKRLEELGIGRPSTYASIISVLQERKYVALDKKRFMPNDLGRLVSAFLLGFFAKYVQYDFTASLEDDLDKVAAGDMGWKELMRKFWDGFNHNVAQVSEKNITEVIDYVQKALDYHLFGDSEDADYKKRKSCPSCSGGELSLKLGKYGAFLACNNYPDCNYKKALMKLEGEAEQDNIPLDNSRELGTNADGVMVYLNRGPYGWYVQLGKALDKKTKPKRCQLPANMKPDEVTLAFADYLLKMPIEFGIHPDTGEKIMLGIGRFGPYLKYQDAFYSISRAFNAFALTMEQAQMILSKPKKPKAAKEPVAPKKASSKAKTTKTTKTKAPAKKS